MQCNTSHDVSAISVDFASIATASRQAFDGNAPCSQKSRKIRVQALYFRA
jgi:hypothetical protein